MRLRPDGALRRPPPEDLHHAVGTADSAPRLLPLRRLPPGNLSARPGPGPARHLVVARHGADGGTGGDERQLRRSERVDGGTGRRGGRPQTGRAHRRSAGPRGRDRRTRAGRARTRRGGDDVPGAGRDRRAGAQVRGGRPARQAARRGRPRPARSSSSPCGRRKHATPTASPNATPGRSATAPRSRARPAVPPTRCLPAFAQRAYREARRRGFDTAARRVVIGDGAEWIWNLAGEQFPGAIEIVDIYHAKGHLCDVAKAIYGAATDLAAQWGKARRDELDAGRIDAILTELRAHSENLRGGPQVYRLPDPQPPPDALSGVSERGVFACRRASSRPAASSPSAPGSSAPACTGPWPAPTPSSPCGAASSVAASRTSGNDGLPGPPDCRLTNLTCTPRNRVHVRKVGDFAVGVLSEH